MRILVDTTGAKDLLRRYAALAHKNIAEAVHEEAKLTAQKLVALTPPKTQGQGRKRVAIDIGKVYLSANWFTEVFQFTAAKLGERIKDLVRQKDSSALTAIFSNSAKLAQITVESFKSSLINRYRQHGRVAKNVTPHSFPLSGDMKGFETRKQKLVGMAKSGWANCLKDLGGSPAGWLNRSGTGEAVIDLAGDKPSVKLVNNVAYVEDLERKGIVKTAIQGRQKALAVKIRSLLGDRH